MKKKFPNKTNLMDTTALNRFSYFEFTTGFLLLRKINIRLDLTQMGFVKHSEEHGRE